MAMEREREKLPETINWWKHPYLREIMDMRSLQVSQWVTMSWMFTLALPAIASQAFSSLPTVAERRKKHMAWIHKQSQFEPSDKPEAMVW